MTHVATHGHARARSLASTLLASRIGAGRHAIVSAPRALGVLSSLLGQGSAKTKGSHKALLLDDTAPTWQELEGMLAQREAELQCAPADLETGPASSHALRRTFGSSEAPRVKLYRDSAAWCPYCQKVWMLLEEKQIPYTVEKINMRCYGDKPASFLAKVPGGLLPVLEIDGTVITESAQIMNVLEERFPERPMLPPAGSEARSKAAALMKLERQHFSAWMQWLTSSWGHDGAKKQYEAVLGAVDRALLDSDGPFFMGRDIGMVDMAYLPFVERAAASLAYYKGFAVRGGGVYRGVEAWFDALEARPAYLATRSDYYTHCHDLPPQLGGCAMHPDGEAVATAIDGGGDAWRLPLPPLSATSSPEPYRPGDDAPVDTTRAAARLIRNHEAVARFAARGAGADGARPVSAPLADPTAQPKDAAVADVDAALRRVAHTLLEGAEGGGEQGAGGPATEAGGDVVLSLAYLRNRVGVPRDLPFPAARQLRAHLNWQIDRAAA